MVELENKLFLTADTCLNVFNNQISTECFGSSPSYLVVSPEQHKKTDFTSVLSMPATPIRQLTNWQQHLFWYEYNELWRIKRLNPKNNKIDIVSTESTDVQHIEHSRLLAGTSQLWQLKNVQNYYYNPKNIHNNVIQN